MKVGEIFMDHDGIWGIYWNIPVIDGETNVQNMAIFNMDG